ncbi:Ferrochelatase [Gossypium australe]|uniref:Ferrochelatase n=1 Tax=Gossypium australe TaxID=47621 RepID=A0A5B6W8W2_9ROSI|nr:Ferrochelatase [Gossypium australe]
MAKDIIRLPGLFKLLQRPLAKLISVLRARKSKEGYAAIGGGSPLRKITDEQANASSNGIGGKECECQTVTLSLAGAMLSLNVGDQRQANAARRAAPPPPEEKKDPSVSGVQAKVLASKKRKEAMKQAMAKMREKGKLG